MLHFQDYIMMAPLKGQGCLMSVLQLIQDEFPQAEQRIYHNIPTFFLGKTDIINIGAYKDHIGLHIGYALVDYMKEKYPTYRYTKSTIQLPYTEPFPYDLVQDICRQIKKREKDFFDQLLVEI